MPKKPSSRATRILAVVLLAALALAGGVRGDDPLSTADLVRFLRAGISERTILAELHERGFAEPLDMGHETALRQAGGSETLVVAVRRVAPAEGAPPPGALPGPRTGAGGSTVTIPSAGRGPTFAAGARTVRVPVSVLDKSGRPVLGLTGEDFQITEDGKPQSVTYFSGERRPLRIALALDMSGSMENKVAQVSEALRHFIDLLEPQDQIMVIGFNSQVDVLQDFTSDREQLSRVFSMLQPAGATALYDATLEAIQRVAEGPAESKAVVLVTDGMDTVSGITFGHLLEVARRSEVPVFSLGLGDETMFRVLSPMGPTGPFGGGRRRPGGRGGWPGGGGRGGWPGGGGGGGWPGSGGGGTMGRGGSDFDAAPLIELADETGGRAEILKNLGRDSGKTDRLKDAVESIAMTLRHRYLVGYEPPGGKRGWRKIKVDVDKPAVTARARKGYYAEG